MTVPFGLFADALVLVHFGFVLFVVFGALAVAWCPRLAWLHVPAVLWGILVEVNAWICPLTPWEQRLRAAAGRPTYAGGFVDHYVVPLLYPPGLTSRTQLVLGALVLVVNVVAYAWVWRRLRRGRCNLAELRNERIPERSNGKEG